MSKITPEMRDWIKGCSAPKTNGPRPSEEREALEDSTEDTTTDRRGRRKAEGYKDFYSKEYPKEIDSQIKAPKPVMITAAVWDKLPKPPSAGQRKDFLKDKKKYLDEIAKQEANSSGQLARYRERAKINKALKALDKAEEDGTDCDLRSIDPTFGNIVNTGNNLTNKYNELVGRFNTARKEIDTLEKEEKKIREARMKVMPFLDTPEQNPERQKVSALLADLEKIDARIGKGKLTAATAKEKCAKLFELDKQLMAWHDRRTQQGLPPSAEALALSDLLQRVHQQVIDEMDRNDLPPYIDGSDKMTPEEKAKFETMWNQIRGKAPGGKISIPDKTGHLVDNDAKKKQFRIETLSSFARLMNVEAGRHLLERLNKSPYTVAVVPDDEDACWAGRIGMTELELDQAELDRKPAGTPQNEGEVFANKGIGSDSVVDMLFKEMDSDSAMQTQDGALIFAPGPVSLGHELTHALHNAKGINRRDMKMTVDESWDNMEEYQTIFKGSTSEQTLRHQYGMSAVRFGHGDVAIGAKVTDAFKDNVAAMEKMEKYKKDGTDLDKELTDRKFDPAALSERLKVELYEKGTVGPLPAGWDPNQLTAVQIDGLVTLGYANKLPTLGWFPYDLGVLNPEPAIKTISDIDRYHERSPTGRNFHRLGGQPCLDKIDDLNGSAGATLSKDDPQRWPTKLTTLQAVEAWLAFLEKNTSVPKLKNELAKSKKLYPRMEAALAVFKAGDTDANDAKADVTLVTSNPLLFGDDALKFFGYPATTPGMGAAKTFLEDQQKELAKKDQNLIDLGHAPAGLTLVARSKLLAKVDKLMNAGNADELIGLLQGEGAEAFQAAAVPTALVKHYTEYNKLPADLRGLRDWDAVVADVDQRILKVADLQGEIAKVAHTIIKQKLDTLLAVPLTAKINALKLTKEYTDATAGRDTAGKNPLQFGDNALVHFGYTGDMAPAEVTKFLTQKENDLGKRDTDLTDLGHTPGSMTLVARDKMIAKIAGLETAGSAVAIVGLLKGASNNVLAGALGTNLVNGYEAVANLPDNYATLADADARLAEVTRREQLLPTLKQALDAIKPATLSANLKNWLYDPLAAQLNARRLQFQREKDIAEGKRIDDTPEPIQDITGNFHGAWKTAKSQAEGLFKTATGNFTRLLTTTKPGKKPTESDKDYQKRMLSESKLDKSGTFSKYFSFESDLGKALDDFEKVVKTGKDRKAAVEVIETTALEYMKKLQIAKVWWATITPDFCTPLMSTLNSIVASVKKLP
jgi:hypothetical protein